MPIELLNPALARLAAADLPPARLVLDTVVHRADDRYRFLHDNALGWHGDTLFAAWYNCPEGEIVGESCIRGRRSLDGGRTWSEPEVIAADTVRRGIHYVPVAFGSLGPRLFAFVSNMVGHDQVTQCEVFELEGRQWISRGFMADHFLPNCAPVRMQNGNWILMGRASASSAEKPAYPAAAISDADRWTAPWRVVRLSRDRQPLHPESTAWVEGARVTALVRGGPGGGARSFRSGDFGETWEGPLATNLPASDSKLYAGILSTGRRYLIWNWPDTPSRNTLVIGLSRPGGETLEAVWRLRHGPDAALGCGPEWSYPSALEHDGHLVIAYTSEKRNSVLSIIPLDCRS